MYRLFAAATLGLLASGCATLNHTAKFDVGDAPTAYVADKTGPDDYPGFMVAEGNIYSCRYGIHHLSQAEFQPPKPQMFAALLTRHLADADRHQVVLERFDVYYNRRLKLLHQAGQGLGGIIGGVISDAGKQNWNVFSFKDLIVDTDPMKPKPENVHLVGCDDKHEGEFDPTQISAGHDVVITWLRFSFDEKPVQLRTFYQFQPDPASQGPSIDKAIETAIERSIEAAAAQVKGEKPASPAASPAAPAPAS